MGGSMILMVALVLNCRQIQNHTWTCVRWTIGHRDPPTITRAMLLQGIWKPALPTASLSRFLHTVFSECPSCILQITFNVPEVLEGELCLHILKTLSDRCLIMSKKCISMYSTQVYYLINTYIEGQKFGSLSLLVSNG